MKMRIMTVAVFALGMVSSGAQAKTFRASEMTAEQWAHLGSRGTQQATVEFREGDEIPLSFTAEGDLLETTQTGVSYVKVKRGFWIRASQNDIEISFDGVTFQSAHDALSGGFSAGAASPQPGVPVNAINLMLKTTVK